MANTYFQFKQFTIHQDRCAMKVGTDGVVLGAWSEPATAQRILDIGTGTGLIALMVAQRTGAFIDAIDIDEEAYIQAKGNANASAFSQRIQVYHSSLQAFKEHPAAGTYDLIISNPPYFSNSLKSPDRQRTTARHTDTLSLDDLIRDSAELLNPTGRISLILPSEGKTDLSRIAEQHHLYITRLTDLFPTPASMPKRFLVELSDTPNPGFQEESLTIEIARHTYTPEYRALTKEYYLHF